MRCVLYYIISYAAFKLVGVGEQLVPTAQQISYLAQGIIAMWQQGITLAGQVMQQVSDAVNMLNATRATCLQAVDVCQFAQQTCKDVSLYAKPYERGCFFKSMVHTVLGKTSIYTA